MEFISLIQHSVDTSVKLRFFKSRQCATVAHIFKSKLVKLSLNTFRAVDNFDAVRLQSSAVRAYPLHDRPRGDRDIRSVKWAQKQLRHKKPLAPIWMICKDRKYTLLDGAHRIVASFIEDRPVYAYVIAL